MADGPPSPRSRGGRQLGKVVLLTAIILVAVLLSLVSWPAGPKLGVIFSSSVSQPSSSAAVTELFAGYVGQAACAECHPDESALHRRSGHDRTLQFAEQSAIIAWLDGKTVSDPKYPDIKWSYALRDGRVVVDRTTAGRTESLPLDYAVGSGNHGVTFVALKKGKTEFDTTGVEHRLSYLADGPALAVTPGQETSRQDLPHTNAFEGMAFGRQMGPDHLNACLRCHATLVTAVSANRGAASTLIPNVSCERCHGPGREHVQAARRGGTDLTMKMGREDVTPLVEVNLCGECHRIPRAVSPSSIRPENAGIVRFQGVGLSTSACFDDGNSGLRCTTCHDPHNRASTNHVHYETACLSCHQSGGAKKACPISPAANCIGCHMPKREVRGNGVFTDHWIRKPTASGGDKPKSQSVKALQSH